jgi:DNA-binding CsgD family transcriptional regulator
MQTQSKGTDYVVLQEAIKAALDRWSLGVIILGADRKVLFMNKAAGEIMSKGDGLRVDRRVGIRAVSPNENEELSELIEHATLKAGVSRAPFGSVMQISRSCGKRPLIAFVTALIGMSVPISGCAVFVSDPDLRVGPDEGLLRSVYGLTAAEAKVAALLVQGCDARTVSEKLAVTFNTARTHVKKVFEKTNTRRQSELVHLILCAPLSSRLRGGKPHPDG